MNDAPQKMSLFTSATLRLTAWYMVLMMVLSLVFSAVLYQIATGEFNRALGPMRPGEMRIFMNDDAATTTRQQRIDDSTKHLVVSLILFNATVLVVGSALSYVLARRTLQPIEEAHEAQARFASDAAHELRTPLAVMQTEIEVGLRDKKARSSDYRNMLASSLEEVSRLRTLTDRLLLLASQEKVPIGPVDVEAATVEALTRVVSQAQKKRIEVDNQVGVVTALGHFESIVDVLCILLDNATKYSPEKSQVTLSAEQSSHEVHLHVSDNGPGIPPEEQQKIFERFYRSDASRSKTNVEGHGLGLSLAKRLAEEMNGSLTVTSDGAHGTTFTLTLQK